MDSAYSAHEPIMRSYGFFSEFCSVHSIVLLHDYVGTKPPATTPPGMCDTTVLLPLHPLIRFMVRTPDLTPVSQQ